MTSSTFDLAAVGTYRVMFQVSVSEAGRLIPRLNGADVASSVVGRATGTSQIVGMGSGVIVGAVTGKAPRSWGRLSDRRMDSAVDQEVTR